jgi:hypothetical protein
MVSRTRGQRSFLLAILGFVIFHAAPARAWIFPEHTERVQRAFADQQYRALYGVRSAVRRVRWWQAVWTAAQARPEAGRFGCNRRSMASHVLALWRGWAAGAAVDAGGNDAA